MRMNFDWNKLQKADIAFWNSVDAAVTTLLCYQAPKINRTSYRAFYGDQRICAVPSSAVFAPQLTNLYNFFPVHQNVLFPSMATSVKCLELKILWLLVAKSF